jgi:hypothetical protein
VAARIAATVRAFEGGNPLLHQIAAALCPCGGGLAIAVVQLEFGAGLAGACGRSRPRAGLRVAQARRSSRRRLRAGDRCAPDSRWCSSSSARPAATTRRWCSAGWASRPGRAVRRVVAGRSGGGRGGGAM